MNRQEILKYVCVKNQPPKLVKTAHNRHQYSCPRPRHTKKTASQLSFLVQARCHHNFYEINTANSNILRNILIKHEFIPLSM